MGYRVNKNKSPQMILNYDDKLLHYQIGTPFNKIHKMDLQNSIRWCPKQLQIEHML